MPEEWRWWLGDRDSYLRERTEELESALSSAHSATSRLSTQLRRVQGTLEQRVDRLATAFDAFIELSDLRTELNAFGDAFTARRLVREIVLDGVQPHDAELVERLPDVPGYWLVPATKALLPLASDDQAVAEQPLFHALELDGARTRLYLATALAVTDRPAAACRWLDAALGDLSGDTVTHAQRQLWLTATGGGFDDAGVQLVADRLRKAVDALPEERRTELTADWSSRLRKLPRTAAAPLPRGISAADELTGPANAAATLAAVRRHCEQVFDDSPVDATDAPATSEHPLAGLLAALVDEGSPDEAPVLRRVAELREVIESNGQTGSKQPDVPWTTVQDDPMDLLTADAFPAKDQLYPTRRAVSFRAATPVLSSIVDQLATDAAKPVSREATVSIGLGQVRLTEHGPRGGDVDALEQKLAARWPTGRTREYVGYGLAGAGVVVALIGIAAGTAPVVLGLLLAVCAVIYGIRQTMSRRQALTEMATERRTMHTNVDEAKRGFEKFVETATQSRQAVEQDITALRTLLQR